MNIIIIGAQHIGSTLAENLASEKNDITVIDTNQKLLGDLQNRLDIGTVLGLGCRPDVLEAASANDADMLLAVTDNDEINMMACQIAHTLFSTPKKIARIRYHGYYNYPDLFEKDALAIDVCISPEQLVMHLVRRLIEHPGALQVLDFAEGKIQLVAIKSFINGHLVGKSLKSLEDYLQHLNVHIAAIFRGHQSIPLTEQTTVKAGDEVFVITQKEDIRKVMDALGHFIEPYQNIMVAGGGTIGSLVAHNLEKNYHLKVIEKNPEQASRLASSLSNAIVFEGDATDAELLISENIESMDIFCALTNDDEDNIMSCLLAKRLGVRHVMALVARTAYADLIEGRGIDVVISPQQATISSILAQIRQGDIVNVHALRRGTAEAIEVVVHGDEKTSRVIGKTIANLDLPQSASVGALLRNNRLLMPKATEVIKSGDHLIVFLVNKRHIRELEKLFQVKVGYI